MYPESDLLPLSALQHLAFCARQCALIHIEQAWAENVLTIEGRIMHERVHEQETEVRGDVRVVRGLRLRSLTLGLVGVADVVEFHRGTDGVALPGLPGKWTVFPVEYKRGKPKADRCDEVQLCGQAMCLEEMLNSEIAGGALFYGAEHKRHQVVFDPDLRNETIRLAGQLHELFNGRVTPAAMYEKRCGKCSLIDECMPNLSNGSPLAEKYIGITIDTMAGAEST